MPESSLHASSMAASSMAGPPGPPLVQVLERTFRQARLSALVTAPVTAPVSGPGQWTAA